MTLKRQQQYMCTRPRLASRLMSAGITATKAENPFAQDPRHQIAWYVDLTPASAKIISDYFIEEQKQIPRTVAEYLKVVQLNDR